MTLPEFITKIESHTKHPAARTPSGYQARCPAHDDRKASLCLSEGQTGRILVKCQAGCGAKDVTGALGLTMKDLFANGNGKPGGAGRGARCNIVATYDYRDEAGTLLFQSVRLDPKDFRQRHPDAAGKDGWTWNMKGVRLVLYRLPELLATVKAGETVFIVEGEKDVAALVAQGFAATCNAGGAGKWRAEYREPFAGCQAAAIFADKDEPGRKHALDVAGKLRDVVKSVKVLELPDVAGVRVKDAADFFAAGGTAEQVRELVRAAPEYAAQVAAANPPEVPLPPFFYDKAKGGYWRETPHRDFVAVNETDLKRHLQFGGVRVREFVGGFGLTKFDDAICRVQNESAVDHVCPLAGHKAGLFHTEDGRRILIPRTPNLIEPRAGDFLSFEKALGEWFPGVQMDYKLGWWKIGLEDFYGLEPHRWRHHQMLALVGKPDCGKSFLQSLITSSLGGREGDPYLNMVGKTDFNEDLAEAEHWKMEDKNAHRDAKSRAAFGGAIKQATVSQTLAVHGKGKKQVLLPTFRRLSMSINEDLEYVTVLPMLDSSVGDKIIILKCGHAEMLPDWKENRARFTRELPALIHYLLNVHRISPALQHGRFGVKTYHAPEIVELLQQFEPHLRLLEVIDAVLFMPDTPQVAWRGTSTELQKELFDSAHGTSARQLLNYSTACGQYLAKLESGEKPRCKRTQSKGRKTWTIEPPP